MENQSPIPTAQRATPKSAEKPAPPSSRRKGCRLLLWNLLVMALVLIAVAVGCVFAMDAYTRHDEAITVPNVRYLSEAEAVDRLEGMGLQVEVLPDSAQVTSPAAGCVYEQSIAEGTHVKSGRIVYLTLSTGHTGLLTLPNIAGSCSLREAQMKLKSLGLRVAPPEYRHGEEDWVYDVKCNGRVLRAGAQIRSDQTITLVVGDGTTEEIEEEWLPDFADDSLSQLIDQYLNTL